MKKFRPVLMIVNARNGGMCYNACLSQVMTACSDIHTQIGKETIMADLPEKSSAGRGVTRRGPFFTDPFFNLPREMEDIFSGFSNRRWPALLGQPESMASFNLNPQTDIKETKESFEISVELPGINEKDVSLTLNDDIPSIKGEKKEEASRKEEDFHLTERKFGSFERSFRLPANVDQNAIHADFYNGVMVIVAPKSEDLPPAHRKIDIQSR